MSLEKKDVNKLFSIFFIPIMFLFNMWVVKILEVILNLSFVTYGIYPRNGSGFLGILTSPFVHKDWEHLINNSYPIFIMGCMLYLFYKKIASQIFLWLFFISGFWLWVIGRESFHIGASGLIYALGSFLFISGLIRKNPPLIAISLLITFLYGSMVWGVLPVNKTISWEGHIAGSFAGILVAFFYRKKGPERKKYLWEIEEEEEDIK